MDKSNSKSNRLVIRFRRNHLNAKSARENSLTGKGIRITSKKHMTKSLDFLVRSAVKHIDSSIRLESAARGTIANMKAVKPKKP